MGLLKKNYEISLWEFEHNSTNETFEERKIAIIGGSDFDAPSRCVNPVITTKVNGTTTFTFDFYTKYADRDNGFVDNPFINLVHNESRIKVHVEDKWYDFIVREVKESSNNKRISYSCDDAFMIELSKSGFELEYDDELMNNQGTAEELAESILDGTQWSVESDIINQYICEPLVEFQWAEATSSNIIFNAFLDTDTNNLSLIVGDFINASAGQSSTSFTLGPDSSSGAMVQLLDSSAGLILNRGDYFYGFYSQFYGNNQTDEKQFIVTGTQLTSSQLRAPLDKFEYPTYKFVTMPTLGNSPTITQFQGYRLVENKYKNGYDKKISQCYKECVLKTSAASTYRVYNETDYFTPTSIINQISESGLKAIAPLTLEDVVLPEMSYSTRATNRTSYRLVTKNSGGRYAYYDLKSLKKWFGGFKCGDAFIFSMVTKPSSGEIAATQVEAVITDGTNNYTVCEPHYSTYDQGETIFSCKLTINNELSYEELVNLTTLQLKIDFNAVCNSQVYIRKVEFFKYLSNGQGGYYTPENQPTSIVTKTHYYVYDPAQSPAYTSLDDLVIIDDLDATAFAAKYNYVAPVNKWEKIRSISGSESNRYNLLQTVCEQFECWMTIEVDHDSTGKIVYDTSSQKWKKIIKFTEKNGDELPYGFISGINLVDAERNNTSSSFTTRLITKPNANEFADSGSCTIATSKLNYAGENVLFNLNYYVMRGDLDGSTYISDFYHIPSSSSDAGGYLYRLHSLNASRDTYIEQLTPLQDSYLDADANYQVAAAGVVSSQDTLDTYNEYLVKMCGHTYAEIIAEPSAISSESAFWTNTKFNYYITQCSLASQLNSSYSSDVTKYSNLKSTLETSINTLTNNLATISTNKKAVYQALYNKYYMFLQEGSWINEEYYDNDEYYLDAERTLTNSTYPQISYSLNVIDLQPLEDFKFYEFHAGDTTFVQDSDFFGWDNDTTPTKLKIYITEFEDHLDSPESNKITVQNYDSDFTSMFKKMVASTQTLQYKGGTYDRASDIVTSDGQVEFGAIADTINNNKLVLEKIGEQTVVIDQSGITTTSSNNKSNLVRIVNDGIFISSDGGESFYSAITGGGINTAKLIAGEIDTNLINIMDGNNSSFRWDRRGINAYYWETASGVRSYDYRKAIRFDCFGLYGVNQSTEFEPEEENDIWNNENVKFGMTWKGYFLRNSENTLKIDSENDIVLEKNNTKLIQIGRIDKSTTPNKYGIRIKNSSGTTVFETGDDGNLTISGTLTASIVNGSTISGSTISGSTVNGSTVNGSTINGTTINIGSSSSSLGSLNIYDGAASPTLIGKWDKDGISITQGSINLGSGVFQVTNAGAVTASNLSITGGAITLGTAAGGVYPFSVDNNGVLHSTSGTIGGWTIGEHKLYATGDTNKVVVVQAPTSDTDWVFAAGGSNHESYSGCPFRVSKAGVLYATNAHITGEVTATSGSFTGTVTATSGSFTGTVTATSGTIKDGVYLGTDETGILSSYSETEDNWRYKGVKLSSNGAGSLNGYIKIGYGIYSGTPSRGSISIVSPSGAVTIKGSDINIAGNTYIYGVTYISNTTTSRTIYPATDVTYTCGTANYRWTDVYSQNSLCNTSDKRTKKNIETLSDNYETLFNDLKPVRYQFIKNESNRYHTGFIAQDIEESLNKSNLLTTDFAGFIHSPAKEEEVNGETIHHDDSYGLRYGEFIALNTWQIQKLKSRVAELEQKISQLTQ